jgi:3-dehydroquinate dehydratase/shikimate dehydrogenase
VGKHASGSAAKNAPASPLEANELNARYVFDLVYNPIETPLLRMARQKGIPVITGVEMFVQQGARQFEIWTGKPAPEEEMLRVVLHALRQGGEGAAATSATPASPEPATTVAPTAAAPATVTPKEKPVAAAVAKATPAAKAKPVVKAAAKAPATKTEPVRKAAPAKPVRRAAPVKAAAKAKPKAKSR